MDPLSEVLSLLKLHTYTVGGFEAGGAWSIAFEATPSIKFYAAVSGACWLAVEGVAEPVYVASGDCFLLPRGRAFRVASDLALTPIQLGPRAGGGMGDGGIIRHKGGGDFFSIGGYFTLTGEHASAFLELLPPIVHIRTESDKEALRWCIERMRHELRDPQPGGTLVAQQLATMVVVQALRLHLAEASKGSVGWLFALADKQMAAALKAMHNDPAARWTLQSLAERAGMSRTTFAVRFKETVGVSPMEYLTHWRMQRAAFQLTNSSASISSIARSLGYESESAFSTAFKRVMGMSPRQYGR